MLVKCADCDEIIDNTCGRKRCPRCQNASTKERLRGYTKQYRSRNLEAVKEQQRQYQKARTSGNHRLIAAQRRAVTAHAFQELGTVRAERLLDQILKGKVDYVGTR